MLPHDTSRYLSPVQNPNQFVYNICFLSPQPRQSLRPAKSSISVSLRSSYYRRSNAYSPLVWKRAMFRMYGFIGVVLFSYAFQLEHNQILMSR